MSMSVTPLQDAFWLACEQMLLDHTYPMDLDTALVSWGYSIGPCEAQDLMGLDVVLTARSGSTPAPVLARMVAEGRLGKVNNLGFFCYSNDGGKVADPLVDDLIREEANFAGRIRDELKGPAIVAKLHDLVGPVLRSDPKGTATQLHITPFKVDTI